MAERWFGKGADVEVMSPDGKFRGTLFPAKVVSPSRKRDSVLIEYKSLVTIPGRDLPPKRHREVLPAALLRPAQPTCEGDSRLFKCGGSVDACVNGGWSEGVITKELKEGAYLVSLRNVKQGFLFLGSDLRVHREWVKGCWSPPLDGDAQEEVSSASGETLKKGGLTGTTKRDSVFVKGMLVEVRNHDDGLKGSWYLASITKEAGPDKFFIEYRTLKEDENSSKPLIEEVEADHMRPFPPEAFVLDRFDKRDKVDVFYNDGWWEGEVVKVMDEMKYKVYFEGTDDELVVHHAYLRPHQDWLDGEWVMYGSR